MADAPDNEVWELRYREQVAKNRIGVVGFDMPIQEMDGYESVSEHIADKDDPHDTKADLALMSAVDFDLTADTDDQIITVLNTDVRVDSNLHVTVSYKTGDIAEFAFTFPATTGAAASAEMLIEVIYNLGGENEAVISSGYVRTGNQTITLEAKLTEVVTTDLADEGDVGVYFTGVASTITLDGSTTTGENALAASRIRKFQFRAYPHG
jgi:hypothetical protein